MKFRELKKYEFVIYVDLSETYYVHKDGILTEHIKWEYDNGLYINSGIDEQPGKWKTLKRELKESTADNYSYTSIWVNKGYCHRCGKKLTKNNFNFDTNYLECPFEFDYFYCNECKAKEVEDYEKFMSEYKDEYYTSE